MAEGCSQSPTMESSDLCGMETSVSESLSDKSMTSSISMNCDQTVSEEENILNNVVENSVSEFSLGNIVEGKKMDDMEDVIVNHYDSDSSLYDQVYNAIIERNCNLPAFKKQIYDKQTLPKEQLYDKKTSYIRQAYNKTTFSKEQKISSTQKIQSMKTLFTKQLHKKTSSSEQFYDNKGTARLLASCHQDPPQGGS